MMIALSIVSVAFAAFAVWLTVRIINRREKWAKWTGAILATLPVLYVLSFGPVCWLTRPQNIVALTSFKFTSGFRIVQVPDSYFPIGWAASRSTVLRDLFARFAHARQSDVPVHVPVSWDGVAQIAL